MGTLTRHAGAALVGATLLATAAPAGAGMVTIWPDQLVPTTAQTAAATIMDPDRIVLDGSVLSGQFYAPVKLPLGARVTKLEYLHKDSNDPGSQTAVDLKRSRHAEGQRTSLWFSAFRDVLAFSISYVKVEDTEPEGGRRVLPGYRHWVYVYLNGTAAVGGIRIYYR